eukprot:GHUV01020710.1.p1 GENE.GHUV01020710.1~~GHUV01020710.1.p1  ORF type:complete len:588 (+),score=250.78 GHUV01020710.1:697-2460(+)
MPLHYAALGNSIEVLRFLIQRSTWLAAADAADDTALHLAARHGWLQGVQLLLGADSAIDVPNKRGLTALGEAVAAGQVAVAQALIKAGADVGWRASGYTLLHIAAGVGRADMLQVLLQHQAAAALVNDADNSDSATPLHAAAMTGSAACVELLLQHEADASAAGTGQLLAWELVPTDSSSPAVQQLRKQLQEAAGVAPGAVSKVKPRVSELNPAASPSSTAGTAVSSRRDGTKSKIARAVAEGVHASADPVAAYAAQFAKLNGTEQGRKVDTFARTSGAELAQLDFLTDEARQAISQVRRAHQLLSCYRAVAALRTDEQFQEDASDAAVQSALQEMALRNNMEKYKDDRQVMSVAAKLKKFHTVIQEAGGIRLGLQDVLVKPGQSLTQLVDQDTQQIEGLTAAAAAARRAAVAAITGRPAATISSSVAESNTAAVQSAPAAAGVAARQSTGGVKKGSLGHTAGAAATVSSEISPAEPLEAARPDKLDLDAELQQHRKQRIAAAPKHPDDMAFWERTRYEVVNSFKQAVKIMCMVLLIWGVMWCLGLLPGQGDPVELERRMLAAMQARQGQEDPAAQQGVEDAGHSEL